jgi:hypothetical protein
MLSMSDTQASSPHPGPPGTAASGPASLLCRTGEVLRQLSVRPGCLLLAMLALNALFLPYRGMYHDANLYGLQVANQVQGGAFADDLFLRYGSQDKYSLFSRGGAPLAAVLGVRATFLLLYVAGTALFFWALMRLVFALLEDRRVATLGLLALAVALPSVGGHGIFHINESFFTPRLLANALVLLGLERMLAGRPLVALSLLAGSMLLHPLMGFAGLLLFVSWVLLGRLPLRWLAGLAGAGSLAILAVLLVPSLGKPFFGYMDPAWKAEVYGGLPCLLSTEWSARDWLTVFVGLGVVLLAWWQWRGDPRSGRFLASLALVTLLGIVGSVLVCFLPYALTLQGQPFRVLWLAQTFQYPLAVGLAWQWWQRPGGRILAVLLVGYLAAPPFLAVALAGGLLVAVFLALLLRTAPEPRRARWVWLSLASGVATVLIVQTVYSWAALIALWPRVVALVDVADGLHAFPVLIAPGLRLVLGLGVVAVLARLTGWGAGFRVAALVLTLAMQFLGGVGPHLPGVRERARLYHADLQFVQGYLRQRARTHPRKPTVYWPNDRLDHLWFDLRVPSYFSMPQLAGNVFSRGTAMEGQRRAALVAPFELEMARHNRIMLPPHKPRQLEAMFREDLQADPPGVADLLNLCADEDLDLAVVRQGYPGLYAATNGTWYLYDCEELRSRPDFNRLVRDSRARRSFTLAERSSP